MLLGFAVLVLWKHRENITRLIGGTEPRIMSRGPKHVIIKKGEHGAFMFTESTIFFAPAYPLESVFDPTGAGDSFAGGFMGYLARTGDVSEANLRRAVVFGREQRCRTAEPRRGQKFTCRRQRWHLLGHNTICGHLVFGQTQHQHRCPP